jgi:hypothetical protein
VPLLTSPAPGLSDRIFALDSPDRIDKVARDCFGLEDDIELGGVERSSGLWPIKSETSFLLGEGDLEDDLEELESSNCARDCDAVDLVEAVLIGIGRDCVVRSVGAFQGNDMVRSGLPLTLETHPDTVDLRLSAACSCCSCVLLPPCFE